MVKVKGEGYIYDGLLIRCIQCNDISMTRLVGHSGFTISGESRTKEGSLLLSCSSLQVKCWDIDVTHHASFTKMCEYQYKLQGLIE